MRVDMVIGNVVIAHQNLCQGTQQIHIVLRHGVECGILTGGIFERKGKIHTHDLVAIQDHPGQLIVSRNVHLTLTGHNPWGAQKQA